MDPIIRSTQQTSNNSLNTDDDVMWTPFKNNIWTFLSNNDQQLDKQSNYNTNQKISSFTLKKTYSDDSSIRPGIGIGIGVSIPNSSEFDMSIRGLRSTREKAYGHIHTINGFLTNSIWSTSENCVDSATDLESWNASNPIHLTEMYGNDEVNPSEMFIRSDVTLPSHSTEASAFEPYSRINHFSLVQPEPLNSTIAPCLNNDFFRGDEEVLFYPEYTQNSIWSNQHTQPDLKSWDAFNPIHLTEMYRNNDEKPSQLTADPDITLPNHSAYTSAFVPYSHIKQLGLVQPKSLHTTTAHHLPNDFFKNDEGEDLFYSEITHFKPIESFVEDEQNFVDGHTFNVSNALDTIEFECTSSGLLRYKSEDYLKYTCNDFNTSDKEEPTIFANHSKSDSSEVFVVKFPVKHSGEIACQTEECFQLFFDKDETYGRDGDYNPLGGTNYHTNNIDNNLRKGYGCGLKHLYKLLLKKFSGCCLKQKSSKKEQK